jgi:ABC-type lipoprotein release transport system permease subunit
MVPQAVSAMSLKMAMPGILRYLGYRRVLISNTMILGLLIILFATIGVGTPVWLIVVQVFVYGFFTSMQYTSMNTLVYADVTEEQASSASTIAGHGVLHSRPLSHQRAGNDSRHPPGVPRPGRMDDSLRYCFPRIEKR